MKKNPMNEYIHIKDVTFDKDFITINTTINKGDNNVYDLRGGERSGLYTTTGEATIEFVDKNPRTVGIIDLWKAKKQNNIDLKYRNKIEKLKSEDKLTLLKIEFIDKARQLFVGREDVCFNFYGGEPLTKETEKQISLLQNEESAEDTKLLLLYKEIMAQLVACETYEQEINILNIYGVLKDGKVNA